VSIIRQKKLEELNLKLLGKTFGQRKVISYVGYKNAHHIYLTHCSCGYKSEVAGQKLLVGKLQTCKHCKSIHKIPCQVCGCIGRHKNIDLHKCDCDYLGFCSTCDGFDIGTMRLPRSMLWYRTRKIRKLAQEKEK
jgi:hypothetical protein